MTIKGDIEENPENYDDTGKLREDRRPKPTQIPIFNGVRKQEDMSTACAAKWNNSMRMAMAVCSV